MTDHDQDDTSGIDENTGERLRIIGAELSAAGLAIQLHHTQAGLDLTATLHHSSRRETDVIVDEDGYTELRYWADPAATPAQVANPKNGTPAGRAAAPGGASAEPGEGGGWVRLPGCWFRRDRGWGAGRG